MKYTSIGLLMVLMATTAGLLAQASDPTRLKDQLTGDAKGSAAANPQCKLFSPSEIAAYVGKAVGAGENAAGGAGCNWTDKEYEAQALLTVVGASQFPEPSLVKGFKRLQGIGDKAWVAPDSGWSAGALIGDSAIVVNLDSSHANEATVIAFLREAVKRRRK